MRRQDGVEPDGVIESCVVRIENKGSEITSSTLSSARSHSCPTASTFAGYLRGIPCRCTSTQFCNSRAGDCGLVSEHWGREGSSRCLFL